MSHQLRQEQRVEVVAGGDAEGRLGGIALLSAGLVLRRRTGDER